MPAKTVFPNRTALVAHVPVDKVDIVDGPHPGKCMAAQEALHSAGAPGDYYVGLDFTLTTPASTTRFRRTLKVATIFGVNAVEGTFEFTAVFSGCVVSGVYNMWDRTGWFNLD